MAYRKYPIKHICYLLAVFAIVLIFQNCSGSFSAYNSTSSSSSGASLGTALRDLSSVSRFEKANQVLQQRCVSCHGGTSGVISFYFNSENEIVNTGLVTAKSPTQSRLIQRLKNFKPASGQANNMPSDGTQLSYDEYNTLYSWILQMATNAEPFQCIEAPIEARLVASNAKRLSQSQYTNSVRDVLRLGLSQANYNTVATQIFSQANIPLDSAQRYTREDTKFNANHADAYFSIADRLSDTVSSATYYSEFVQNYINLNRGTCASINPNALSAACKNQLIRNLGARFFRRPLIETVDNNELQRLASTLDGQATPQQGLMALTFRLSMSPQFLHILEDNETLRSGSPNIYELSNYSIVNRLSYTFWNTMPDETLFTMARDTDLRVAGDYSKAVRYVLTHAKAQNSIREFTNQWLKLESVPAFEAGDVSLQLTGPGINFSNQLRRSMIGEVEELAGYITASNGTFQELFTTEISFARDPDLMAIYAQSTPAPVTPNVNNLILFPANQRRGVLTRAALLQSGSAVQSPIHRGVRVRREILCIPIGSPPPGVNLDLDSHIDPKLGPLTTRSRVHIATSQTSCNSCHKAFNPIGFALGNYNGFGKFGTLEPIFSALGDRIETQLPIDNQVDLSDVFEPGARTTGSADLGRQVASNSATQACLSREYLRYSLQRPVSEAQESCRLSRMFDYLYGTMPLLDFMGSVAMDPDFKLRKIDQ